MITTGGTSIGPAFGGKVMLMVMTMMGVIDNNTTGYNTKTIK